MEKLSWKIGNVLIDNPIVIAPMAGVSNYAFRSICKEFGAGLIYGEMLSDKALYYGNEKTVDMCYIAEDEHPLSLQLFGSDIDTMVKGAIYLDQNTCCDIIDINMGCPVLKVVKNNGGSALLKDEEHAVELVRQVVKAVKKPVSVKMRIGWDEEHINCVELAQRFEVAGASCLAIHGRTRQQMYEGKANWEIIGQVKAAVRIPVIGNGDIRSVADLLEMQRISKCDAFMIGRGIIGNPYMIREAILALGNDFIGELITPQEKLRLLLEHAKRLVACKGEEVACKEMRGHAQMYVKGFRRAHALKKELASIGSIKELEAVISCYLKSEESFVNEER